MDLDEFSKLTAEAGTSINSFNADDIVDKLSGTYALNKMLPQSALSYVDSTRSIFERASQLSNMSLTPSYFAENYINELGLESAVNFFGKNDLVFTKKSELEIKVNEITSELRDKNKQIESLELGDLKKEELISSMKQKITELERTQLLKHLLPRLNEKAQKKLFEDDDFVKRFQLNQVCRSVVLSMDIRDSTQLMLNAKNPTLFAQFISSLSLKLYELVTSNFGVYDKFTGDGLLCFFPEFYSGSDALYYAIKTAAEAHQLFYLEYEKNYQKFSVVRADVGLGIGIDYGDTCLTSISSDLTVVGIPVVYACRLSAAPANHTFLNQSAFELLQEKYTPYYSKKMSIIGFKNQGSMYAYDIDLNFDAIKPNSPDWV